MENLALYIGAGTLGLIVIYLGITYNSLTRLKNDTKKAFSGIDVQLKRRTDLIPNLINTIKGYATHEKQLLENITKARTQLISATNSGNIKEMANSENMLTGALKSVFAVAENYPELKANNNYLQLQQQLEETEDQIAASRRIYNENATYLNNKIEMFPSNLIAKIFNFSQKDLFKATEQEKQPIKVEF